MAPCKRIGFVYREPSHSHGASSADRAIMELVVHTLAERGAHVVEVSAEQLRNADLGDLTVVLSMARSIEYLSRLASHRNRVHIINDPLATLQTLRDRLYPRLAQMALALPPTRLVAVDDICIGAIGDRQLAGALDATSSGGEAITAMPSSTTSGGEAAAMPFPFWLKRKDYHHLLPGDVVKIETAEQLASARAHFAMQDHPMVFQQQHVSGRNIKAYGVYDRHRTKLTFFAAREQLDAAITEQLRAMIEQIVTAIPLDVFGADFILTAAGPVVVDVNAWPSFRQCLRPAAQAIADMIWAATN